MRRGGLSVWVRLYICVCVCVCVSAKNTAVCCLTARKSPRNSSLPLGVAIYILRKMPRKPEVFCRVLWPWVSNSCTAPRGIEHYGNWVCRPTTSLRERWDRYIGSPSKRQELGCGTESRSIPAQSKPTTCLSFTEWQSSMQSHSIDLPRL